MAFAIYGESEAYVHLVTATSRKKCLSMFLEDVKSVGCHLSHVYNVYAVENNQECKSLEDEVHDLIEREKGVMNGSSEQRMA
jgi:hypothetical protein